jgi:hypothetical protein
MININKRIKILKTIVAQTVPTMNTVKSVKSNPVTPVSKPPVSTPKLPDQPKSNVIEPPKKQETTPQPANTMNTTPIVENEQPKTPQVETPQVETQNEQEEQNEQEKQSNNLFNIVKEAINLKKDKMLDAKYYYKNMNFEDYDYMKGKMFAIIDVNGIMKITKLENKNEIIKNNTISIYEPVNAITNNFSIKAKTNNLKDIVNLCKKLNNLNINCDIYKTAKCYNIRCSCDNNLDTKILHSYIEGISDNIEINLNDLKVGKLKKAKFSLNEGTLITIG